MVIVKLMGGLGNQMFQYALAKHYQLRGEKVFLETSSYSENHGHITKRFFELSAFNITVPQLPKSIDRFLNSSSLFWKIARKIIHHPLREIAERSLEFDKFYLEVKGPCRIVGYFQSPEYFEHIHKELRIDFTFRPLSLRNEHYASSIENSNSVSIHIRRGDYATDDLTNRVHGLLPLSYYKKAVDIINAEVSHPTYFVFTDDPAWAHENLSTILANFIVVEGNMQAGDSWEDLCLISRCKHNIIANSSFSWWAAWLNSYALNRVIAPENWCRDPDLNRQIRYLVPSLWTRVQNL